MSLSYRRMRPSDVRECVKLIGAHPLEAPRYGNALTDSRAALSHLLSRPYSSVTTVVEERDGARSRIVALGASMFVSDEFLRELKTSPSFWIGPELARRIARGRSPVLSEKQVQELNSHGGLNLATVQGTIRAEDMHRPDVGGTLLMSYFDLHQGYLLKEMVGQAASVEQVVSMRDTGGLLWNFTKGCYGEFPKDLQTPVRKPHVIGVVRETAHGRIPSWGNWGSSLFLYRRPRFGFTAGEQRLLLSAMEGGTDEELSDQLGLSVTTVKKTWRLIYDRSADCIPELSARNSVDGAASSERGRGKKQRLIAYLREHPEELRPISRKLLQQNPASNR